MLLTRNISSSGSFTYTFDYVKNESIVSVLTTLNSFHPNMSFTYDNNYTESEKKNVIKDND